MKNKTVRKFRVAQVGPSRYKAFERAYRTIVAIERIAKDEIIIVNNRLEDCEWKGNKLVCLR